MEWLADPTVWTGLLTLVLLEVVLGIDNLVFIAILSDKLPPEQRDRARTIGLTLALLMRLGLLTVMSYIIKLTQPLFEVAGHSISGRDLILLFGGLFLLFKATMELHERLEGRDPASEGPRVYAGFGVVVAQIVVLDAVFSLDAVITAVGMVEHLPVMMAAVIIAMAVMLLAAKPLTRFVSAHPTVVMLCLGFLLMIGFSLVAEGMGFKVPKGYLYAAIGFSILIETFNQWARFSRERRTRTLSLRQRTAEAVIRLLAPQAGVLQAEAPANQQSAATAPVEFAETERDMIRSVLSLAERPVQTVMTPRTDIMWLDLDLDREELARRIIAEPRIRMPASRGELDRLQGVVQSHDLLVHLLSGQPFDLEAVVQKPLLVPEGISALRVLERIRTHPIPMAVVVDEYGSVRGLVTANDLLATIAGDLADTQEQELGPQHAEDESWTVDATMSLDDLERATGIALEREGGYFTLSGLILHRLDRIPEVGDQIELEGWRIDVLEVERRRVVRARLSQLPAEQRAGRG